MLSRDEIMHNSGWPPPSLKRVGFFCKGICTNIDTKIHRVKLSFYVSNVLQVYVHNFHWVRQLKCQKKLNKALFHTLAVRYVHFVPQKNYLTFLRLIKMGKKGMKKTFETSRCIRIGRQCWQIRIEHLDCNSCLIVQWCRQLWFPGLTT